jgi:hypothetical protein
MCNINITTTNFLHMAWNAIYKEFYLFVCEALFGFAAGQSAPKYGKKQKNKKTPSEGVFGREVRTKKSKSSLKKGQSKVRANRDQALFKPR